MRLELGTLTIGTVRQGRVSRYLGYMRQNKTNSAQPVCRDATVLDRGTSPVTEGKTMNANWMFEEGHLVARNESGHLLRRWLADEAMGAGDMACYEPQQQPKQIPALVALHRP